VWPLPQGKPWPCLPVRLYKAKRVMRMVLVNPGQSNMLLTGELVTKDCTGSQLLHATPAHTQAEMRRNRRRAAAAAARRSTGLQHTGQLEQGFWQQQQQQERQQLTACTAVASDRDSGTCDAVPELQQLLAGLTAGDAARQVQNVAHQEQQHMQRQVQQQQQQQSTPVAGEEQRQLLLHAVQQAREHEVIQQQQQQQAMGSCPDSTTFLQRIGASLWSRSSSSTRQSTFNDAVTAAAPATSAPSELRVTSAAAAADHNSGVGALAASIQQLLAAMRELAAVVAASKIDNDIEPDSRSGAAAAAAARQDQLLQVVTQLQQHHLCSAEDSSELLASLRIIAHAGDALLQMPGFRCQWGLDVAGSDASLQRCARPAAGTRGLLHAPVALDAMLAAAAAQQAVSQSCHAVQAAADEASASGCDRTTAAAAEAAVKLVQQLMQDLPPFAASIPALHSQQQQQGNEQSSRPCLAVLRIWRLHAQLHCGCSTPQQLAPEQQQMVLPFVVLCSERSVRVSPCGRLLVAVVAVRPASSSSSSAGQCLEQLDASTEEFHQVKPLRRHMCSCADAHLVLLAAG
jgi:hypothetical protein